MLRYCLLVSVVVGHALCQTGLSSTDSQTILNEHNRLRGLVSPTATNMQRMVSFMQNARFWEHSYWDDSILRTIMS